MAYETNYSRGRSRGYDSGPSLRPSSGYTGFSDCPTCGYGGKCSRCGNSDSHIGKYGSSKSVSNLGIPTLRGGYS